MKELQNGRSMIEMLGVLAIIGVLSIGGLAGYTMAMNRNRANNIAEYVSRCAVVAQTSKGTGALGDLITGKCSTILDEAVPAGLDDTGTGATAGVYVSGDLDKTVVNLKWATGSDGVKKAFGQRYSTATTVNPHIDSATAPTQVLFYAS